MNISKDKYSSIANDEWIKLVGKARAIQEAYWTFDSDEKERMLIKGVDALAWNEVLRLLHLTCLEMLSQNSVKRHLMMRDDIKVGESKGAPAGESQELIKKLVTKLISKNSPYHPRYVLVWQVKAGESGKREPDMRGILQNASLTHLGCLEVLRLDTNKQPVELCFVAFDSLRGVLFASPALFRYAKLLYDDGRSDEIVFVPLLYGISWSTFYSRDQDGTFTRFLCHMKIKDDEFKYSIGVGHQDFILIPDEKGMTLFGLGSVVEFMVPLHVDDPRFKEKCRARGLDPETVLKSIRMH